MVKLIKLVSQPAEELNYRGQFTANFQEDIILKPFSKIALRNIFFSEDKKVVIGEGMGILLSLKTNTNGSLNNIDIPIPSGEYTTTEMTTLLFKLINKSLSITDCPLIRPGTHNRVMFNTQLVDNSKLGIYFYFMEDSINTSLTTNPNISYDDTTLVYSKTGNDGEWDFISTGVLPISQGTGIARFALETTGVMLGVASRPNLTNFNDIDFKVFTQGIVYYYQFGSNTAQPTAILIEANDIVELLTQNGKFQLQITRDGGAGDIVSTDIYLDIRFIEENDLEGLDYYNYFGLLNDTSSFKDIYFTPNPFYKSDENGIKIQLPEHVVINSLSDAVPSDVNISFYGVNEFAEGLHTVLGFTNISYKVTGVSGSFVAENIFFQEGTGGYAVFIDNLRLTSYDFSESKVGRNTVRMGIRKNILSTIIDYSFDPNYSTIEYETDFPIFIDIDNKEPVNLGQLSISIRYLGNNEIIDLNEESGTDYPIIMTLLID